MNHAKRRLELLRLLRSKAADRYFQWGQPDDSRFFNGATACSATTVQLLVWLWTGRHVSLNDVGKAAGYPTATQVAQRRGLYPQQVINALARFGVAYRWRYNASHVDVLEAVREKGPVPITCTLSWIPERKNYRYFGAVADGRPNGFARPFGQAGNTQLSTTRPVHHMVLVVNKYHRAGTASTRTNVYIRDPNRGSVPRPEINPYDTIYLRQFERLYESGPYSSDSHVFGAAFPVNEWEGQP